MASVTLYFYDPKDCDFCEDATEPHQHTFEIPKCPDCKVEMKHTSTRPPKSVYSCMNKECNNGQHYYVTGTPITTKKVLND